MTKGLRIKNFIWDFDGMLFDTYPHTVAAFCEQQRRHGFLRHEAEVYALFKINLGFITVCVLASFLVWHADFGLWLKGLILLGFGVLLLLINRRALSRKQKAEAERQVEDA